MSICLTEELLEYSKQDFCRWISRDFSIIDSRLPTHARNMLIEKTGNRQSTPSTTRFFSEMLILNEHAQLIKDGIVWYSSYKWLTKDRWLTGKVAKGYKAQFYHDLMAYIGREKVISLQRCANSFRERDAGKILGRTENGKVRYPVAPDIWLLLRDGTIKFIECKHNEKLENTQLVGLALIKKYLTSNVSIVRVYSRDAGMPSPINYDTFSKIYDMV